MSAKYKSPSFLLPNELNTSANPANDTGINSLYSMDFDGGDKYVDVGILPMNGDAEFSISIWFYWFKGPASKPYMLLFGNRDISNSYYGVAFDFANVGAGISQPVPLSILRFGSQAGSGAGTITIPAGTFNSNAWNHLCMVKDATTANAYVNNQSPISVSSTRVFNSTASFKIGRDIGSPYDNKIDEVAIFNRALNTTEIAALYDGTGSNIRPSNLMATDLNPIAYYPLGEQAQNSGYPSATGNEWQFPNGVLQDYVMDFNGSSDYISINNNISLTGNKTVSVWFKADNISGDNVLIGGDQYYPYITSTSVCLKDSSGFICLTVPAFSNNVWYHLCIVGNGTTATVYIDGQSQGTLNDKSPTINTIGALSNGVWPFNGEISNVAIWNTDQSANIANIYNNGSPQTSYTVSPQNWWKLNADSVYTPSAPNYTTALDFVASESDYVEVANSSSLNFTANQDFSLSAWFKKSSNGWYGHILKKGSIDPSWLLRFNNNNKLYFLLETTGGVNTNLESTVAVTDTEWHHVVAVADRSSSLKIYLDGVLVSGSSGSSSFDVTNTETLRIGTKEDGSEAFNGEISNVAIFNSALTSSQVSTLFNFGTPETNISFSPQAWWKLDDQTAITDSSNNGNTGTNNGATDAPGGVAVTPSWKIPTALPIPTINYKTAGSFNGTSSKVSIASTSLGTSNTVSFWFYHNSSGSTYGTLVGGSTTTNPGLRSGQAFNIGGTDVYCSFDAAQFSWNNPWFATGNIKSDNWNHVVFVRDASKADADKIQLSINNSTLTSYDAINFATPGVTPNFSTQTNIANSIGQGFSGTHPFEGFISNVSTFTTAFTQAQVNTLYNNGQPSADISSLSPVNWWKLDTIGSTITDNGSAGNNGTNTDVTAATTDVKTPDLNIPVNGVSTTLPSTALQQSDLQFDSPYSNYSLSFDGTNSINCGTSLNSSLNGFSNSFSVSLWVKVTNTSTRRGIIGNYTQSSGIGFYIDILRVNDTTFTLQSGYHSSNSTFVLRPSSSQLTTNNWYHLSMTVDSGGSNNSVNIYVDGVLNNGTSQFSQPISYTNTNNLKIANIAYAGDEIIGKIDETSIFNYALSSAQILEIYNNGRPKDLTTFSGTAPISWWRLGENAYFDNNSFVVPNSISGAPNGTGSGTITTMISADAPGTYANGVGENLDILDRVGDAPLSVANSQSYNMIPSDISPYVPQYVGDQIANTASMTFNGVDSFFDTGNIDLGINSTLTLWFKPGTSPVVNDYALIGEGSNGFDYVIRKQSGAFYVWVGSSFHNYGSAISTNINANGWNFLAIQKVGDTITVYLKNTNGEFEATATISGWATTSMTFDRIGARTISPVAQAFSGQIDEVAGFSEALTPDQIKFDLYEPSLPLSSNKTADIADNPNLPTPVAWYRMGD